MIDEVVSAAKSLSHERIGAHIVFERSIGLNKLYDHSVQLNALVSEQLLMSIFQSFSPLHDGAVIVQQNRISCASAQLPLSKNPLFSKKLGTRHSAAVGISEETDAVVLVVSEETGSISIAWEGNLQKQTTPEHAKQLLNFLLLPRGEQNLFSVWLETQVFLPLNKISLELREKFFSKLPNMNKGERRRNIDRRGSKKTRESNEADYKQVEYENKLAANAGKSIFMRISRGGSLGKTTAVGNNLTLSNHNSSPILSIKEGHTQPLMKEELTAPRNLVSLGTGIDEYEPTSARTQNEALKSIAELSPSDRFDPPIPKPPPPRDVSIGGVSLNPPIEKKVSEEPHEQKSEKILKTEG